MQSLSAESLRKLGNCLQHGAPNPRKSQGRTASIETAALLPSFTNALIKPRAKRANPAGTMARANVDIMSANVTETFVDQMSFSAHQPFAKSLFSSVLEGTRIDIGQ